MPTKIYKMGFEGQAYYGAPGATASTPLPDTVDITITMEIETGETTARDDSSAPPIETVSVTARKWSAEIQHRHNINSTPLEAMRVAQANGDGIALRLKDKVGGKGFDGDVVLSFSHGMPLKGEQAMSFSAQPTKDYGRAPQLYV